MQRLRKDMDFHRKLIANYPNDYAQNIIENIRIRIFIYEHEFMAKEPVNNSAQMHQKIIHLLRSGEKSKAIRELNRNWEQSIQTIIHTYQAK